MLIASLLVSCGGGGASGGGNGGGGSGGGEGTGKTYTVGVLLGSNSYTKASGNVLVTVK
jgi:hypothetical protein